MNWMDMSLRDFQSSLASSSPTPGGGTAAAVALGQAAALTCMVADLTIDKEKWQEGWQIAIDDEAYIFDAVVVICDHGLTHAEKLKEFFRRFRYTKQVFVYVKKRIGHVRANQLGGSYV